MGGKDRAAEGKKELKGGKAKASSHGVRGWKLES
jgi:hypothetical protein